jgi:hypothetical protein
MAGQKKNLSVFPNREVILHTPSGALNFTGTEASGADIHMSGSAIHDSLDTLHVGLPGTVGTTVRVGNLNAEGDALATKIAFSHFANLLARNYYKTAYMILSENSRKIKRLSKIFLKNPLPAEEKQEEVANRGKRGYTVAKKGKRPCKRGGGFRERNQLCGAGGADSGVSPEGDPRRTESRAHTCHEGGHQPSRPSARGLLRLF